MFPLNKAEKHSHASEKKTMGKQIYKEQLSKKTPPDVLLAQNSFMNLLSLHTKGQKKGSLVNKRFLERMCIERGNEKNKPAIQLKKKKIKPQTKKSPNVWMCRTAMWKIKIHLSSYHI